MLFLVLIVVAISTPDEIFYSFSSYQREIELNLVGFCSNKITEVYIQENSNITGLGSGVWNDQRFPTIFTLKIPFYVEKKFSIILVAYPKIIRIGCFRFNYHQHIERPGFSKPVIEYMYDEDIDNFNDKKEKIISGKNTGGNFIDDHFSVSCFSEKNKIYLDLTSFKDFFDKVDDIFYREKENNTKNVQIIGKYPVSHEKIKAFDFTKNENVKSEFVLCIEGLEAIPKNTKFDIYAITSAGFIKFENLIKNDDGTIGGHKNYQVPVDWSRSFSAKIKTISNQKGVIAVLKSKNIVKEERPRYDLGWPDYAIYAYMFFLGIFIIVISMLIMRYLINKFMR